MNYNIIKIEFCINSARVAQWIRRRSPKPKIASSNLAVGKHFFLLLFEFCLWGSILWPWFMTEKNFVFIPALKNAIFKLHSWYNYLKWLCPCIYDVIYVAHIVSRFLISLLIEGRSLSCVHKFLSTCFLDRNTHRMSLAIWFLSVPRNKNELRS